MGRRRRATDAKALVAEVIISWVVKDHVDRMAGLELCPEAGHRGESRPKWRYGCQTTANPLILNLSYLHMPKVTFQFHNHHAFLWVWRWLEHVDARGKLAEQSHCQTGEFPQEIIKGSLSISTHTRLSPGFLSQAAGALAEGSHRALILLWGSSSRHVVPASSFPGLPPLILSYSNYAFGIHHIPYIRNL